MGSYAQKFPKDKLFMSNAANAQFHRQTVLARVAASFIAVAAGSAALPAAAASWSTVAMERNSFSVNGAKTVRYGMNSKWVTKTVSGRAACSNEFFGNDPMVGTRKMCQVDMASTAATPAPAPAPSRPVTGTPAPAPSAIVATPAPAPAPVAATPAPAPAAATPAPAPAAATGPTVTATMASTTLELPNPERGFYGWTSAYFQDLNAANLQNLRDSQGLRLTLGLVNLSSYRSGAIPQSFIDTLSSKFALLRSNGVKVILRAVYNYDSGGADANAAQIKAHAAQLAPLFAANADVIAYVQAGFVGAWGEWHSSASGNTSDANKATVRDAVLSAVPSTHQVQFRYPYDMIKWYPTALTSANAFNGSAQSRTGVHNDCFMSDNTDVGTYQGSLTNNSQRDYVKKSTEFTPFGGETCSGFSPMRQSCAQILQEGSDYHLTYLNINFYTAFMSSWKSGGCYAQVTRSMGYRFQLDAVTHPTSASRNTAIDVSVDLRNVGWSRIFSARKLVVTLRHKSSGALITAAGSTDMRTLPSQATSSTRTTVRVTVPSGAATGEYDVLLGMPDVYTTTANDSRFAVRFANADSVAKGQAWETSVGRFDVGTSLTVQ
ncbi:hypothetical protein BH09PSE5_BH09PSE5_45540 [soil metagenome]